MNSKSVKVTDEMLRRMRKDKSVNWSEIARMAWRERIGMSDEEDIDDTIELDGDTYA